MGSIKHKLIILGIFPVIFVTIFGGFVSCWVTISDHKQAAQSDLMQTNEIFKHEFNQLFNNLDNTLQQISEDDDIIYKIQSLHNLPDVGSFDIERGLQIYIIKNLQMILKNKGYDQAAIYYNKKLYAFSDTKQTYIILPDKKNGLSITMTPSGPSAMVRFTFDTWDKVPEDFFISKQIKFNLSPRDDIKFVDYNNELFIEGHKSIKIKVSDPDSYDDTEVTPCTIVFKKRITDNYCKRIYKLTKNEIEILSPGGTILARSKIFNHTETFQYKIFNHSETFNDIDELKKDKKYIFTDLMFEQTWYYTLIIPYYYQNKIIAIIAAYKSKTELIAKTKKIIYFQIGALSLCLLVSITISLLFGSRIANIIISIARQMREISVNKNLDKKITIKSKDEIGVLTTAFNEMVLELKSSYLAIKKAEEKYRSIFENSIEGIFQITIDGRFMSANPSMANFFGYDSSDDLISSITNIAQQCYVNPDDFYRLNEIIQKKNQISGIDFQFIRKDGNTFWGAVSIRAFHDEKGMLIYYEGVLEDITERIKAAEAMKVAKDIAEASNKAKSDFLMNMSHELRTPLNGVIAASQLISISDKEDLEKIQKIISSSSQILLQTVEHILDFAKSKDGELELVFLPFRLDDVLTKIESRFFHKGMCLTINPVIVVESKNIQNAFIGDECRLLEILNILLENAAKFSNNSPEVTLSICAAETSSEDVLLEFSLADNGIGISKEHFGKIFEPFFQVDTSSTRQYDGVGIGLSVCIQLVELMGGKIWVESELEEGSKFYFTVRFKRQEKEKPFNLNLLEVTQEFGRTNISHQKELQAELDIEKVAPIIQNLNKAFSESALNGIQTYITEIKTYKIPGLSKLLQKVDDYEYDEAALILKEIAVKIGVQIE